MSLRENLTVGEIIARLQHLVASDARVLLTTPTTVRDLKLSGPEIRQLVFDGVANTDYKERFVQERDEHLQTMEELRSAHAKISDLQEELDNRYRELSDSEGQ